MRYREFCNKYNITYSTFLAFIQKHEDSLAFINRIKDCNNFMIKDEAGLLSLIKEEKPGFLEIGLTRSEKIMFNKKHKIKKSKEVKPFNAYILPDGWGVIDVYFNKIWNDYIVTISDGCRKEKSVGRSLCKAIKLACRQIELKE